jgi:hypothetical protein
MAADWLIYQSVLALWYVAYKALHARTARGTYWDCGECGVGSSCVGY